ncbi:MAG: hypothetical protein GF408_04405 [Candidatus Omnitrophica bacterium]|nr:hypothetical protein [Candidatus Omnitrophota bacterium]
MCGSVLRCSGVLVHWCSNFAFNAKEYMQKATRSQLKKVKDLLRDKKSRDESGLFVVEGEKIIRDAADKGILPEEVFMASSFGAEAPAESRNGNFSVSVKDMEKISSLRTSQGILAVFRKTDGSIAELIDTEKKIIVLADGMQDPGNLGSLLRSSSAFGAGGVLLYGDTVDVYNPKVVRASGGAVLDIPVVVSSVEDIETVKSGGFSVMAGSVSGDGAKPLESAVSFPDRVVLAFGSEGQGLSREIEALADEKFYIPIENRMESLNVTVAASIALYFFSKR